MEYISLLSAIMFASFLSCDAFFKPVQYDNLTTYIPTTIDELKNYLCGRFKGGVCVDTNPAKIVLNQVFDLTTSEGTKKELGCYHLTVPAKCLKTGQVKLNVNHQCDGLVPTTVKYNQAGRSGLSVGSNKIIVGENGGGLKGKGLQLKNSSNVEIRNLTITDINPHVIWGGDALDLMNVTNVLIDGNYIKYIGRQMIVTHFGSNTGVLISNNVFDGNTPYSPYCDGAHYWLWLFIGDGDRVALRNNVVHNTSGRGPHVIGSNDSKILVHMLQNTFYNINHAGLIELDDTQSSILVEGNIFVNVTQIVHVNKGNIFVPLNTTDQILCESYLGRQCLSNKVINSGKANSANSLTVLMDFQNSGLLDRLPQPILG